MDNSGAVKPPHGLQTQAGRRDNFSVSLTTASSRFSPIAARGFFSPERYPSFTWFHLIPSERASEQSETLIQFQRWQKMASRIFSEPQSQPEPKESHFQADKNTHRTVALRNTGEVLRYTREIPLWAAKKRTCHSSVCTALLESSEERENGFLNRELYSTGLPKYK